MCLLSVPVGEKTLTFSQTSLDIYNKSIRNKPGFHNLPDSTTKVHKANRRIHQAKRQIQQPRFSNQKSRIKQPRVSTTTKDGLGGLVGSIRASTESCRFAIYDLHWKILEGWGVGLGWGGLRAYVPSLNRFLLRVGHGMVGTLAPLTSISIHVQYNMISYKCNSMLGFFVNFGPARVLKL